MLSACKHGSTPAAPAAGPRSCPMQRQCPAQLSGCRRSARPPAAGWWRRRAEWTAHPARGSSCGTARTRASRAGAAGGRSAGRRVGRERSRVGGAGGGGGSGKAGGRWGWGNDIRAHLQAQASVGTADDGSRRPSECLAHGCLRSAPRQRRLQVCNHRQPMLPGIDGQALLGSTWVFPCMAAGGVLGAPSRPCPVLAASFRHIL